MHDLEITWPEGQARFSPDDSPVLVGRSPDAGVILTEPSVSRRHIEFIWTGSVWTASDSSTHGSFDPIGVRLAPTWTVGTDTTIRLGGVEGVELRIELVTTRAESIAPPLGSPPPVEVDQPPAPPGLDDLPPLSAYEPPSAPAAFDAPPPPGPSLFDPPPPAPSPSALDAPDSPAPPHPGDSPPAPPPPGALDEPAQQPPPQPPPQQPPGALDQPPSAFDQPPQQPPPAQQPPSAFDQPPQQPPSALDQPPSAFDQPPQQAPPQQPPSALDQPPPAAALGSPAYEAELYPEGGILDAASATAITDATVRLSIDGNDYTFLPGTEVTLGRDPSCLVTIDERHSLVSRRHLRLYYRDEHWWIEDYSSKGTFIDGRRISSPYKVEGAFMAQLGGDDAGTPLRVIAAGEHRPPRRQSLALIIAIAILAAIAIAALAVALLRSGSDEQAAGPGPAQAVEAGSVVTIEDTSASDLATAKQATVLLIADEGLGSGFFVSDKLIVTNQHVAALAPSLFVAVSREPDEPAIVEYEAETVAVHPFLDIAVLELARDLEGNAVDSSGLTAARIGDSRALTLGDSVYNTGFPANLSLISRDDMGELLLPPVGTTSGEAASFSIWPGCSNPDQADFIPFGSPEGVQCSPDGDVDRGIVITTFSSGQGASGSPVFHGSEVIAVVFAGPEDEANAGRNITTASFDGWLRDVIAANG